jgi:hypothetical protein
MLSLNPWLFPFLLTSEAESKLGSCLAAGNHCLAAEPHLYASLQISKLHHGQSGRSLCFSNHISHTNGSVMAFAID